MKSIFATLDASKREDVVALFKEFKKSIWALGVAASVIAGCGPKEVNPNGGGTGPGPSTGPVPTINFYNITGPAGSITFNKADSSLFISQNKNGIQSDITISASQQAKGDVIQFSNSLIKRDNITRYSSNLLYLKDYDLGMSISAGNKNIGQTADGKNKIKSAQYEGVGLEILVRSAKNMDDVMNVIENPTLTWKLTGNSAENIGGTGKSYKIAVFN